MACIDQPMKILPKLTTNDTAQCLLRQQSPSDWLESLQSTAQETTQNAVAQKVLITTQNPQDQKRTLQKTLDQLKVPALTCYVKMQNHRFWIYWTGTITMTFTMGEC